MPDKTPIDNLRLLLDARCPDWIPFSLDIGSQSGFSKPIERKFHSITGEDDPAKYFGSDIRRFSLNASFGGDDPAALQKSVEPGTMFDEWGIGHWSGGQEGTVDKTYPALASAESVRDIEALPLPVIDGNVDISTIQAHHAAGYPVFGYGGSIYEWSWWIRGMERFMMDMVSDTKLAQAIIQKVETHTTRLATATARSGIDVVCLYDDAGTQSSMQISPELWRRFIKPAWKRVLEAVRAEVPKTKFFLHSCGKIEPIIPDIIELGFHILHPLQPECMDFDALYREYGRDIVLAATISSQKILPFGSHDEVRQEVRRLARLVGEARRCILMPSNVIQPETPWDNIVAFAEEALALRRSFEGCRDSVNPGT